MKYCRYVYLVGLIFGCAHPPLPAAASATSADVSASFEDDLGQLDWGQNPVSKTDWTAADLQVLTTAKKSSRQTTELKRVLSKSRETLDEKVTAIPEIHIEGNLFNDPEHLASDAAVAPLRDLATWALCARIAPEPLRGHCKNKASNVILNWATINTPTGDPINDSALVPLLYAMDLSFAFLNTDVRAKVKIWLETLIFRGDAFYANLHSTSDGRIINNWQSWRIGLRGLAAAILRDQALIASTKALLDAHIQRNILADGATVDFKTRDALHYHIYNLIPLVELASFVPQAVSPKSKAAIEGALLFIRPFYTSEAQHIEFLNTKIPFDITRKNAGDPDFLNLPWKPSNARPLLLLARGEFPAIRSWTDNVVDENYHPIDKTIASLRE